MNEQYDWRDEPRHVSVYSLSLLVVFVGAVIVTIYIAAVLKPWEDDTAAPEPDARTFADQGLTPLPPEQVTAGQ